MIPVRVSLPVIRLTVHVLDELEEIQWKVEATPVSLRALLEGGLTAVLVPVLFLWVSSAIEVRLLRNVMTDLSMRRSPPM